MKFPGTKNEQNNVKPKVRKLLDAYDWFWWNGKADAFGKSGISDILAVCPGVFMVVECKSIYTSHGKAGPTAPQLGFLNTIKSCKHFAFVVNEANLWAFEQFLEMFKAANAYAAQGLKAPVEVGGPLLDAIKALTDYPEMVNPNMDG